jgi:hypothetical protein
MKSVSTIARLSSPAKCCMAVGRQHLAEEERAQPEAPTLTRWRITSCAGSTRVTGARREVGHNVTHVHGLRVAAEHS